MQKSYLIACASAFSIAAASFAGQAYAADPASSDNGGLEEIIVTAQKRSENIQNVPIAVTAIGGDALSKARVISTRQLELAVPALSYGTDSGFALPFLRGIGTTISQPGTEPSVATFEDGVYVAAQQGTILNLLGIDRVEVLAGPQGTLYGRNASGGAINLYTLTPKQELEAQVQGTYGNYNRAELSGHVSGGVTDRLAIGVYGAVTRRHTYLNFAPTLPPGQSQVNKSWGARLKAVWEPVDGVKLTGSIERLEQKGVDGAVTNVQPNALGVTLGGSGLIQKYTIVSDVAQFFNPGTTAAVLREEVDLGFGDLVGISGYRHLRTHVQTNIDGTNIPLVYVNSPMYSRQYSQEVQILSKPESPIKWIAGLYYLNEKGGFPPLHVVSGILFAGLPFNTSDTYGLYRTESYAAFAQATFPITTELRITAGGRYTRDHKVKPPGVQSVTNNGMSVGIPDTVFPGGERTWSKFTPKVTVEYKIPDVLLYATYAKGFKSGQFNSSQANDNVPVNPESLTDYEIGMKSDLFDRRLRINLAAYYYTFKGLQVQALDPAGGVSAVLRNAASARAYGAEANIVAAITPEFTVNFSGAYEHSEYRRFDNAPFFIFSPFGNQEVLGHSAAGAELVRAPKFVGSLGGTYSVPLADGSKIDVHGDAYYNDGFFWDASNQMKQPRYTLVNASLTYTLSGGNISAQLWGTNLTNKYHRTSLAISAPFGTYRSDDEPRMYGVTLTWRM